ncbi:MAG: OmpA family protein [Carboxylicivirga sp.]|nr:OmpA family protein [Carboxylicivirga sp.]
MIPLNVYINKDTSDFVFIDKIYTDEEGRFEYLAPIDYNLKFVIDDPRVLDKEINLDANTESDEDLVIKTEPVKTLPKQAIILNNIYYETNKYSLTQESKANIDSTLLKLLKQYEDLSIEIISHTDNQGTDKYNMKLSHRRANSVVKYLIENGINKHRLIAVGKGESEPLAENANADGSDNPEGRALNRRTEFKVHYTE